MSLYFCRGIISPAKNSRMDVQVAVFHEMADGQRLVLCHQWVIRPYIVRPQVSANASRY